MKNASLYHIYYFHFQRDRDFAHDVLLSQRWFEWNINDLSYPWQISTVHCGHKYFSQYSNAKTGMEKCLATLFRPSRVGNLRTESLMFCGWWTTIIIGNMSPGNDDIVHAIHSQVCVETLYKESVPNLTIGNRRSFIYNHQHVRRVTNSTPKMPRFIECKYMRIVTREKRGNMTTFFFVAQSEIPWNRNFFTWLMKIRGNNATYIKQSWFPKLFRKWRFA